MTTTHLDAHQSGRPITQLEAAHAIVFGLASPDDDRFDRLSAHLSRPRNRPVHATGAITADWWCSLARLGETTVSILVEQSDVLMTRYNAKLTSQERR